VTHALGGSLRLERFPYAGNKTLRAWDAADEYALDHIAEHAAAASHLAVVNDAFGALTTALVRDRPGTPIRSIVDSHTSLLATRHNLGLNDLDGPVTFVCGPAAIDGTPVEAAIVKIPRTLGLLEDQLRRLRSALHPEAVIVGAGMTRHIHSSTLGLFEGIIGPTTTSLARKKARLIHATLDPDLDPEAFRGEGPFPTAFESDDGHGSRFTVYGHGGVFSRERLDAGTGVLLEHVPQTTGAKRIVDLGCGSGILGTRAALENSEASLLFVDDSYAAVESARLTFRGACGPDREAEFRATDALHGIEGNSADLILNNPPFHDGQVKGDAIAWSMFTGAKRVLRPGGELWVVGNRHLGYHDKLRRIFGNCETVSSHPKFVVLVARRSAVP
jgi:16S rRNA (guanine1207-N2)-methyltransferase